MVNKDVYLLQVFNLHTLANTDLYTFL